MIIHHSQGMQFTFNDGYCVSLFYPKDAMLKSPEPVVFAVSRVEVAFFQDRSIGRLYFNPHTDFSLMGEYLEGKGEIVYDYSLKLFNDIQRFIAKFNLVR